MVQPLEMPESGSATQGDLMQATVSAVHRSATHSFSKQPAAEIELLAGLGVRGDAHEGARVKHRSRVKADPTQPNLRQVHLMHEELFADMADEGFTVTPGDLGENITTRGIDLLGLPVGAVLRLGPDALLVTTGLRNPCTQIENFQSGLLSTVLKRDDDGSVVKLAGIMTVVVSSGIVRPGDDVDVSMPPAPLRPLERV